MNGDFIWRDAGRTVVFRSDGIVQASQTLREHGFARHCFLTFFRENALSVRQIDLEPASETDDSKTIAPA